MLDGTKNKSRLGANAILGVSIAVARAAANSSGYRLYEHIARLSGNGKRYVIPVPFMNVINGGLHAGNNLAFQEYLIVPVAKNYSESLRIGSEIYNELGFSANLVSKVMEAYFNEYKLKVFEKHFNPYQQNKKIVEFWEFK